MAETRTETVEMGGESYAVTLTPGRLSVANPAGVEVAAFSTPWQTADLPRLEVGSDMEGELHLGVEDVGAPMRLYSADGAWTFEPMPAEPPLPFGERLAAPAPMHQEQEKAPENAPPSDPI
jgi:hypothetical protein